MSYGYGGRANPFDQRDGDDNAGYGGGGAPRPPPAGLPSGPRGGGARASPPRGNVYGGNQYQDDVNDYGSSNVEMASLTQNASSFGQGDPNAILNECADIGRGIDTIDQNLNQMKMLQQRTLDDADSSANTSTNRQLDSLSTETMAYYRSLTERVRQLKSKPESQSSRNSPQVTRIDRRLKEAINAYQQVEAQFRKKTQDQMARQYKIVRPDADESEVRAAVEDPTGGQVFQQALMQSNRRGQAQSVLNAVQDRHAQLQKIEQQLIELAQLFQDMDTLVIQQEVAVANIEQKAEETVENFDKGNEEIGTAIVTAKSTRKKKWICLGIVVAIIVVIVIVVVIYVLINKKSGGTNAKRSIQLFRGQTARVHGRAWDSNNAVPQMKTARDMAEEKRYVLADVAFNEDETTAAKKRYVLADVAFNEDETTTAKKRYVLVDAAFNEDETAASKKRYVLTDVAFKEDDAMT